MGQFSLFTSKQNTNRVAGLALSSAEIRIGVVLSIVLDFQLVLEEIFYLQRLVDVPAKLTKCYRAPSATTPACLRRSQ